MAEKPIIYFLCTGNSCRSQMAEGFGKKYLGDCFDVYSAGIEAHGLNPYAVQVMREVGIDISSQTTDVIDPELLNKADVMITLCGDANGRCPMTPPHVTRWHCEFDDPAKATGTKEEKLAVFRRVRDEIEERIKRFCDTGVLFVLNRVKKRATRREIEKMDKHGCLISICLHFPRIAPKFAC